MEHLNRTLGGGTCDTCSAWSELLAKSEGGEPVKAVCLNPASGAHGTYMSGKSGCNSHTTDPALADHPSVRAPDAGNRIVREVTKTSPISGTTRTRSFSATEDQWAAYDSGQLIQRALPHLTMGDREFLMTGITDEEWDEAFPEDDEDPSGLFEIPPWPQGGA